jgi:glycerophosphoryl diester phosphodiesterase
VRTTRDGIPVLFHDPGLSSSLVRGLFCNGSIADLSLAELRANCSLSNGEVLPTVEEALTAVIDDTEIEGIYLDMKVPEGVLPVARMVSQTLASLDERNSNDDPSDDRKIGLLVAITSDAVLSAWHEAKSVLEAEGLAIPPCLLEYDPNLVLSEGCVAWGPSWTSGLRISDVERLRAAGVGTVFWTISQSDFIDDFLRRAQPNGIITGRGALLFHRYQKIGTVPEPLGAGPSDIARCVSNSSPSYLSSPSLLWSLLSRESRGTVKSTSNVLKFTASNLRRTTLSMVFSSATTHGAAMRANVSMTNTVTL